ncbi:MAG: hypothetical protein JST61_11470 [Acidobacteria bacterium]|nr:hypothetical protein [Acidobacteriota bacterium]
MSKRLLAVGRSFFAIGLGSIGLMHFYFKNFPGVTVPEFPAWLPLRLLWVFALGAVLAAAGLCILFNLKGRKVAAWTGVLLLALVFVAHVPDQLRGPYVAVLGAWTNALKEMALAGGAWLAAMSFTGDVDELPGSLEKALPMGRYLFGAMLALFGLEHFLYSKFVAALIPAWAGPQMFWTYFAGAALIAGGLGIMVKPVARLASLLTGAMLFVWVVTLHLPRAIADPYRNVGNEWASVFEALAFSGMAFMLAALSGPRYRSE